MKRQAMSVTTKQLRELADKLDNEFSKEFISDYGPIKSIESLKWSIPIINKQPKCSDTWEFEED